MSIEIIRPTEDLLETLKAIEKNTAATQQNISAQNEPMEMLLKAIKEITSR